ncbi:hypothetical protein GCK72_015167 [Caenorhabditis remanei]|uniref:Tyrosine specific protein phosphatases domain-containing protein n=1 Tax=Caenorhabditis remanei TaxID=31234 RepID=A0A6A5GU35_CAERE|nr:hypothetical protein GCK72_015167 [Caenorhabditis remanei]KAF1758707.1 hypothetical protein GCK72_015167 [Caenorhabditis remanei]
MGKPYGKVDESKEPQALRNSHLLTGIKTFKLLHLQRNNHFNVWTTVFHCSYGVGRAMTFIGMNLIAESVKKDFEVTIGDE